MDSLAPMTDEEFLEDRRNALRESVEYFSAKNKPERERWVGLEFVQNLNLNFNEAELSTPNEDPPDVIFRDCRFEVKEILDTGRRRHAEYKESLQKALEATDPQDLLTQFTPKDITPQEIGAIILFELDKLEGRYAPAVKNQLDLLFYVNFQEHFLKVGPLPEVGAFSSYGWRSISVVVGWGALVLFAAPNASSVMAPLAGTLTLRKFDGSSD